MSTLKELTHFRIPTKTIRIEAFEQISSNLYRQKRLHKAEITEEKGSCIHQNGSKRKRLSSKLLNYWIDRKDLNTESHPKAILRAGSSSWEGVKC